MQNDKEKFKTELKTRIYRWVARLIKFLDTLSKDTMTQRIVDQVLRSGASIGANYIEAQASSSKKDFINFFHITLSNPQTNQNSG